ncbi:protein of unknown function [Rhodovastum atsumiense]|nr:protein of unknown function [Rhodovastum atsumiense]
MRDFLRKARALPWTRQGSGDPCTPLALRGTEIMGSKGEALGRSRAEPWWGAGQRPATA